MTLERLLQAMSMIQRFREDLASYTDVRSEFTTEELNYAVDLLDQLEEDNT
jgi:hypothetical protein